MQVRAFAAPSQHRTVGEAPRGPAGLAGRAAVRPVSAIGLAAPQRPAPHAAAPRRLPAAPPRAAAADGEEPETARDAIEFGNTLARASRWQEALQVYEKALTLPGTGLKRYRDKPRLISDGERSAALFNIACCHAQLGDTRAGLVALAGCLELGYDDFRQLRSDPDLAPLREDERFEGLLKRFEKPASSLAGLFGSIFGGGKK